MHKSLINSHLFSSGKDRSNLFIASTSKNFSTIAVDKPSTLSTHQTLHWLLSTFEVDDLSTYFSKRDELKSYPCARWISYPHTIRSSGCSCMVIPMTHKIIHYSYMLIRTLSTAVQPVDILSTGCTAALQADSDM